MAKETAIERMRRLLDQLEHASNEEVEKFKEWTLAWNVRKAAQNSIVDQLPMLLDSLSEQE